MINKLKTALDCKTNRALAKQIGVDETAISRWNKKGFPDYVDNVFNLLLDQIDKLKRMQ